MLYVLMLESKDTFGTHTQDPEFVSTLVTVNLKTGCAERILREDLNPR